MTRTTDERLAGSQVEDLRERVEMINESGPRLAVSIHQNSYSDEGIQGLRCSTLRIRKTERKRLSVSRTRWQKLIRKMRNRSRRIIHIIC